MNNFIKLFISIFLFLNQTSYAGEVIKSGSVLKNDSYVFTVEEATKLMHRVEELEKKEELLVEYEKLVDVKKTESLLLTERLKIKEEIILEKEKLIDASSIRIGQLERYNKFRPLEDAGFALLGVGATIALMFIIDAVEDRVEQTGTPQDSFKLNSVNNIPNNHRFIVPVLRQSF